MKKKLLSFNKGLGRSPLKYNPYFELYEIKNTSLQEIVTCERGWGGRGRGRRPPPGSSPRPAQTRGIERSS